MSLNEIVVMIAVTFWNILAYWFVMMSSLPESNIWQTMKVNLWNSFVKLGMPVEVPDL